MIATQVLDKVVMPRETIRPLAMAIVLRTVNVLSLVLCPVVPYHVRFAAKSPGWPSMLIRTFRMEAVLWFLRISTSTSMGFVNQSASG